MTIYKILNDHTKTWCHYLELRSNSRIKEARQKERGSILANVKRLREVLTYGGYLSLGRAQWSLTCFKDDKAKNQQWSLSGYYDFNDTCYLEQICEILNIAIVDRRKMSLNKAICLSIHNKTELENFLTKGA